MIRKEIIKTYLWLNFFIAILQYGNMARHIYGDTPVAIQNHMSVTYRVQREILPRYPKRAVLSAYKKVASVFVVKNREKSFTTDCADGHRLRHRLYIASGRNLCKSDKPVCSC